MGWSDYTTEDNTALTSKFNFMQCLTLAYNERADFAGISQLAEVLHLSANPVNFCQSFDASLDALIPHFGKIVSGAYVAYTVTSIYTELAETRLDSRLSVYKLNPIYYRLWFEQVIKVINKLLVYAVDQLGSSAPEIVGRVSYSGGANSYYDPATGQYYNFTMSAIGFDDAINNAISSSQAEFPSHIYNANLMPYFYKNINAFYVYPPAQWRGQCITAVNAPKYDKVTGANYGIVNYQLIPSQKIYCKWIITAQGRTRVELTPENIGWPLIKTGSYIDRDSYELTIEYTADENGAIEIYGPWGSFSFPAFALDTNSSAGFVETILSGYASNIAVVGNFVFVAGS